MSSPVAPAPPQYKNRRWLLITAGVVELLMATAMVAMMALMLVSFGNPPETAPPGVDLRMVRVFTSLFYGGMATFLVVVAIGSFLAKNWARIAMLIASWFWLAIGVISMVVSAFIVPMALRTAQAQSHSNSSMPLVVGLIVFLFMGLIYVGLPLAFVLIYSNKHVRMTCLAASGRALTEETAAQPIGRTPRGYPIAVGILVGWLGINLLIGVPAWLFISRPYPFFGVILSGVAAKVAAEVNVLISGYFVWQLYKLRPLGWWGFVGLQLYHLLNATAIFRHGAMDYVLKMQPELRDNPGFQMMPWFFSYVIPALTVLTPLAVLVYLLCIRRYFQDPPRAATAASAI